MKPFVTALFVASLLAAVVAPASGAVTPKKGHYMCYDYFPYPLLVAGFWILDKKHYAGEGKTNKGTYKMGKRTAKGRRINFKTGAYGGWYGYYKKVEGSPHIQMYSEPGDRGPVGTGCPWYPS